MKIITTTLLLMFVTAATLPAQKSSTTEPAATDTRLTTEVEIDASVDVVWKAMTTTEGLKSWVAPLADIDFKVGGEWRANYDANGELGDKNTIINTVLCYDPHRMLALKVASTPESFPFKTAVKKAWSIFYFTRVDDTKTKLTIVGLGYDDTEESQKMKSFFESGNKYSLGELKKAVEKKNAESTTATSDK